LDDPDLSPNFTKSVWLTTTVNFGPKTTCYRHTDNRNLPFGWCAITSLGEFDPKKGGHIVLWDCRLVVEFPPGSTILIPSAAVAHSNVAIRKDETRYSVTQYTAGGIFRWVEHGFQLEGPFKNELSDDQKAAEEIKQANQLKRGLSLFSTVASLVEGL
jgi:hypothetical protein